MSNSYIIKVARPLCLSGARSKSWINSAVGKRFSPALAIWWARWCCHFVSYSSLIYLKPWVFPLFLLLNFIIVELEGPARIGEQSAAALNNIAAAHWLHDVGVLTHTGSLDFPVSILSVWGDWDWTFLGLTFTINRAGQLTWLCFVFLC